jgi:hypothetical protein
MSAPLPYPLYYRGVLPRVLPTLYSVLGTLTAHSVHTSGSPDNFTNFYPINFYKFTNPSTISIPTLAYDDPITPTCLVESVRTL